MTGRTLALLGQTERLLLRGPQETDIPAIVALWTDPQAMRHMGGPRDAAFIAEAFGEIIADPEATLQIDGDRWWAVVEQASGALVGLCSLLSKEVDGQAEIELGYSFLPVYWGRGYATEASRLVLAYAFEDLALESVIALIHPENTASAAVARKLGMALDKVVDRGGGALREVWRIG